MKIVKFILKLLVLLFLITAVFAYINMEDLVKYLKRSKEIEQAASNQMYVEIESKGSSYAWGDVIYTLYKNKLTGLDYEGNILYERMLSSDDFKLSGVRDRLFLHGDGRLIILDDENHLLKEFENIEEIDGIKPLETGFVMYSQDGTNYKTTVYDDNINIINEYIQTDSTVDLIQNKNSVSLLNIKKTEQGLETVVSEVQNGEYKTILELPGYVPLKFYKDKGGYLIATDRELILYNKENIKAKVTYENFRGLIKLRENYLLFSDNTAYILSPELVILNSFELQGFEKVLPFSDSKAIIYSSREFIVIGDKGIISKEHTDRDIINMFAEDDPIVEFRNGFIIYSGGKRL